MNQLPVGKCSEGESWVKLGPLIEYLEKCKKFSDAMPFATTGLESIVGAENTFEKLKKVILADEDYANAWHCNLACAAKEEGVPLGQAERIAERFMRTVLGVRRNKVREKPPAKLEWHARMICGVPAWVAQCCLRKGVGWVLTPAVFSNSIYWGLGDESKSLVKPEHRLICWADQNVAKAWCQEQDDLLAKRLAYWPDFA